MNVLFIAPLPPPITGHSLVSATLLRELSKSHSVSVVDLSKGSKHDGGISLRRISEVVTVLVSVWKEGREADAIYLTVSESVAGNLKDLMIYMLCSKRLSAMYIHLHGGSLRRQLFDRHRTIRFLNHCFVSKIRGAVISGPSHYPVFAGMLPLDKIHIVQNFAEDDLFCDAEHVRLKFSRTNPLRVLYLSGMNRGKGYDTLLEGYCALGASARMGIRLDFAGRFDSTEEQQEFLTKIRDIDGVTYHGVVNHARKRQLFAAAHLFCLPTTLSEGQPISILEAYASGCAVLTTPQEGIRDVFTPGINGILLDGAAKHLIADKLRDIVANVDSLESMALRNLAIAEVRYRAATYSASIENLLCMSDNNL